MLPDVLWNTLDRYHIVLSKWGIPRTGYLVPAHGTPGVLPDGQSCWDAAVAAAAVAAVSWFHRGAIAPRTSHPGNWIWSDSVLKFISYGPRIRINQSYPGNIWKLDFYKLLASWKYWKSYFSIFYYAGHIGNWIFNILYNPGNIGNWVFLFSTILEILKIWF